MNGVQIRTFKLMVSAGVIGLIAFASSTPAQAEDLRPGLRVRLPKLILPSVPTLPSNSQPEPPPSSEATPEPIPQTSPMPIEVPAYIPPPPQAEPQPEPEAPVEEETPPPAPQPEPPPVLVAKPPTITVVKPPTTLVEPTLEKQDTPAASTGRVVVASANIRSGPGTSSRVVGLVRNGQSFKVLGTSGSWVNVQAGSTQGWIHRNLIDCPSLKGESADAFNPIREITSHLNEGIDEAKSTDMRSWMSPIEGRKCVIGSPFGMRVHPIHHTKRQHTGQDIPAYSGTPILAPADGVITFIGKNAGYGNQVRMRIGSVEVSFSHMNNSSFASGIRVGDRVRAGTKVGLVGSTGQSTGPHLHYEVIENGRKINPMTKFTATQLCRGRK